MGFKLLLYKAILFSYNVTPHCITTRYTSFTEQLYQINLIKIENIAVDEIGRIIFLHLLAGTNTYFHIKLLWMNDAVTFNIVAHYNTVQ